MEGRQIEAAILESARRHAGDESFEVRSFLDGFHTIRGNE
jgi:hypothetical protein